jgi:putative hydrolase of the HAD superfamily
LGHLAQYLVIDGDDTLWENNVYFEDAAEEFIDLLQHSQLTRAEVRAVLDDVERANLGNHGYGSAAFARNLEETFRRLAEREIAEADLRMVAELGGRILSQPMELRPGVEDTLRYLAPRHDLTLFTKGHLEEQRLKVDRSGLARFFARVVVTPEKDVPAYRNLIGNHGMDSRRTWMIGNSPRSDVNPALAAGLRAVYIPHPRTWSLEVEELVASDELLILESFEELRTLF